MELEQRTQEINTPMLPRVDGRIRFWSTLTAPTLAVEGSGVRNMVFSLSGQYQHRVTT